MNKICTSCEVEKPVSEFTKKKKNRDGYASACAECTRKRTRKHYRDNKKYYKNKAGIRKKEARQWFKEYKATLECELCGEDHPATLDFHHKDPSEKDFMISEMIGFSKKKLMEEISKCMVVCANCHRKIHAEE